MRLRHKESIQKYAHSIPHSPATRRTARILSSTTRNRPYDTYSSQQPKNPTNHDSESPTRMQIRSPSRTGESSFALFPDAYPISGFISVLFWYGRFCVIAPNPYPYAGTKTGMGENTNTIREQGENTGKGDYSESPVRNPLNFQLFTLNFELSLSRPLYLPREIRTTRIPATAFPAPALHTARHPNHIRRIGR